VEKYGALVHKARHAQSSTHEARVVEDLAMTFKEIINLSELPE